MNTLSAITIAPLLPWPWLAGLTMAALAVWSLALLRGARGAWLRLLPLAVLVLALVNPRLITEDRQSLPDIALVMVDDTPSQAIGDRRAQTEAALAQVQDRLARQPGLEVRVERVAGGGGGDDGTRLFTAMDRALADVPRRRLAGVIMITDGRIHDVPTDKGKELGAPLHALITGKRGERDRRLTLTRSPGYALVGKTATLGFKVEDAGGTGNVTVDILVDGQPYVSGTFPANRETSVDVPVRHAGTTVVELSAEAGPGELSLANNRAALGISGVRDRLKVLLISGEPHAGERTWRNLLKADPAVDLVHFTILRPPEKDDRTPIRELALITFPVRELFEEKLGDFDLVVFDRYRRRGVLASAYYQLLTDYVRKGGALLAAVGPEFAEAGGLYDSALGQVLPAEPTGRLINQAVMPTITEMGKRHPVTASLPGGNQWGSWLRQVEVTQQRGSTVLAGADGRPLLILDKVGEGRVAQLLSDTLWLWARGFEGGGPHDELLRRLAHWLMKEPELEEESLAAEIKGDRLEVLRHSLAPPPPDITITRPDGSIVQAPLEDRQDGRATANLTVDQPGLWRVEDGQRTAIAAAGSLAPLENAELTATPDALAPVAETTGGSVRFLGESGVPDLRRVGPDRVAAGRDWAGLVARGEHTITGVRDISLAPALVLLVLVLGGLLAVWRREGR
ncbi:MAG: hypothetical protein H7Z12_04865 [Rhodospirillaceae bacterium]|nr:hypothetical protein [Rhodospirillales bacterium]